MATLTFDANYFMRGYFDNDTWLILRNSAESCFCSGALSVPKIAATLFSNIGIADL
jgi:hypothetical protein